MKKTSVKTPSERRPLVLDLSKKQHQMLDLLAERYRMTPEESALALVLISANMSHEHEDFENDMNAAFRVAQRGEVEMYPGEDGLAGSFTPARIAAEGAEEITADTHNSSKKDDSTWLELPEDLIQEGSRIATTVHKTSPSGLVEKLLRTAMQERRAASA